MSKDVIIAGAIAVGCIGLIAVAFIAPKSKTSSEAEASKTETTTTITDPGLGGFGVTSGMGTGGLDPMNPPGGINALPPIGAMPGDVTTGGFANGGIPTSGIPTSGIPTSGIPTSGLPNGGVTGGLAANPPGMGTTSGFGTGGATTSGFQSTGGGFDTMLVNPPPVTPPVEVAPVSAESKTHVVANGELLGDIALKYYKSSKQWRKIAEANPGIDPKNLKIGQKLVIPGVEAKPVETAVVAAPGERTYTIKSGDTLYVVAKKELGSATRWKEIEKLNGVSSSDLRVGQVIKLPASAATSTSTDSAAAPATGSKTHTVAKGELLGDISKKYYGTTKNWKKIVEANPGTSPEGLKVGQKLVIPEVAGSASSGTDATAAAAEYVIKSGDTLSIIAQKELGSKNRWKDLQDANPGLDPRNLRAGQKIKIPGKKSDAAPAAPEAVTPPPAAPLPAAPLNNPGLGNPGLGNPGSQVPPSFGQNPQFGDPSAGQVPSNFPADPSFASPYGGSNFGEPMQPFSQTGPGFSQTGVTPVGAPVPNQFPSQPTQFGAPGAPGADPAIR